MKPKPVGRLPWYGWTRESTAHKLEDSRRTLAALPWRQAYFKDPLERPHAHDDDEYLIKFGWLSARFRRSKWWFFAAWLVYEFVRACFYGAAAGSPLVQVWGLLAWEILSLFAIIIMRPFESNRLNMMMVYFLGFSKVASVALCSAFDPRFGLGRILTTVIGIIIIVIQGVLIICMLIAIIVGCVSSWMSVRRYKDDFRPRSLANQRTKYFAHIEQKATDKPKVKPMRLQADPMAEELKEPYFSVSTVRRQTKIEDEDPSNENNLGDDDAPIGASVRNSTTLPPSRAGSIRSRNSTSNLPYGARRHRASWSTRDFSGYDPEQIPSGMNSRMSLDGFADSREELSTPNRRRTSSIRHSWTNDPSLVDVANAATDQPPAAYRSSRHSKSKSFSQLQRRFTEEALPDEAQYRPATGVR